MKKPSLTKNGKDEMNLVEFPITLLSKRHSPAEKTIEFFDTITDKDSKVIKRQWTVTGSERYGLPLSQDNDVWVALLLLGKENNFKDGKIFFTRYKLCQIMDIKATNTSYKRIEESLDRLKSVNIKAKNAFWDNKNKKHITVSFSIIDNYYLYDNIQSGEKEKSYIKINEILQQSIRNSYIKNLDLKLYFSFRSAITKRLYRYLDKNRYEKEQYSISLKKLAYVHLGFNSLTYKYPSKIKEKLNSVHEELIKVGFLKSIIYQTCSDGKSQKIIYRFGEQTGHLPKQETEQNFKYLSGQDQKTLIYKDLIKCNITVIIAEQLLKNYSLSKIENQIKALPFRKAKNSAAVLIKSIKEDWALPEEFNNKNEKFKVKINKENNKKQQIKKYLNSLTKKEYNMLLRKAKKQAQKEGSSIFKNNKIPEHVLKGYLFCLVEEILRNSAS